MRRGPLALAALAVLVLIGAVLLLRPDQTEQTAIAPEAGGEGVDTSGIEEMALGQTDAPVTVIEYASFTCPHCATFHASVFPQLKEEYIATGRVRFVHREVYFDRPGLWAGMVARCGGPMRYFGLIDMIYARQEEWTAPQDPAQVVARLRRIGLSGGLTDDDLDACLSDAARAETLVAWYQQNAAEHGIEGTPSFVIGGETHANMSYAALQALLDEALATDG